MRVLSLLALCVGLSFLAGMSFHRRASAPPGSPTATVQKIEPSQVHALLLDRSQPWFAPEPSSGSVLPDVLPPVGARTDMPAPPGGSRIIGAAVIDYLLVSPPSTRQPLPKDHPFYGHHFEILDLRPRAAFDQAHVPYSTNVPYSDVTGDLKTGFLSHLEHECILVAYGSRYPFTEAIRSIEEAGFRDLYLLQDGFEGWLGAGLKTLATAPPPSAPAPAAPAPANGAAPAGTSVEAGQRDAAPTISAKALYDRLHGAHPPRVCFVSPIEEIWRSRRIPGAVWVPFNTVKDYFDRVSRDESVVFYCGCCKGQTEGLSGASVHTLQEMGFKDVCHLAGHLDAWEIAGFEVDRSPIK